MATKKTKPQPARKAHDVEPSIKASNLKRLNRIEGQVRGIARMVEDDRYCADIIVQVASVQEALRGVSRELMRNHLRHCATHSPEAVQGELLDIIYKHLR